MNNYAAVTFIVLASRQQLAEKVHRSLCLLYSALDSVGFLEMHGVCRSFRNH